VITTYSPLNKLDSINGFLFLSVNSVMETMDGFKKLSYIKDYVHWGSHRKLKNLDGLSNLESVGALWILANAQLENIDGLSNLKSVETDFTVQFNEMLTDLCSLRQAVINGPIKGTFYVKGNGFDPTRADFINGTCRK
jgi:hypothetical protein